MRKVLKIFVSAATVAALCLSVASCNGNKNQNLGGLTDAEKEMKAIAEQYVPNVIYATYGDLAKETGELYDLLADAADAGVASLTQAKLDAICAKFLQARQSWEETEAFLFGAATDFGIDPHIDTWPLDVDGLATELSNAEKVEALQGEDGILYAAAKLGQEVGIDRVIFTAHQMGIKSDLERVPSLALGSSDVNLLELVNAYTTIINDGKAHEPVMVTRILDRDGHEIYVANQEQKQVVTYRTAFFMQELLRGGLNGTSYGLQNYIRQFTDKTDFGGKTGTSNNHPDAWFVGIPPKLVCGAWVGGEYRAIHFRTGALGQGGKTALPICGQFFESVLSDPQFQYYHGHFAPVHGDEIRENMYDCSGWYSVPDSSANDSLVFFDIPNLGSMDEYTDDESSEEASAQAEPVAEPATTDTTEE